MAPYTTKHDDVARQMFDCAGAQHRFSETGYSKLFIKHGSFKEYEQAAKSSCYGVSTDVIADVLHWEKDQEQSLRGNIPLAKKRMYFMRTPV